MNLIILCMLSVFTRSSAQSLATTKSAENLLEKTYSTPLIFNQRTEQLNELSVDDADKNCQRCLIGCPANAATQSNLKQFNDEVSIGKRSIFVKNIINEDHEYVENKIVESANVCEEPFGPSMVFDEKMNTYEVGYELYYEKEKAKMKCRKYDEFAMINANANKKKNKHARLLKNVDDSIAVKSEIEGQTMFIVSGSSIWMFCWISVMSFKIDGSKHQISVKFKSDSDNAYETFDKCNDYSLGSEFYESVNDVNFYYSKPENMFEKLDVLPLLKNPETQAVGTVERVQIISMMFLHTKAARLASCTYMNTALVWSTIVEGQLKLVDRYLYTIFKFWSPNVNIIFGVSDVLEVKLQDSELKERPKGISSLILPDPNKPEKIKIPKLIYRVVEYRMPKKEPYVTYYAVIVIHNHPSETVTVKDRLCEHPLLGWEVILNNDPKKGLSYACPLLRKVNRKLGAFDKFDYPNEYYGTLQLSVMSSKIINETTSEDYIDVRSDIQNKMKELFPDQKIPEN